MPRLCLAATLVLCTGVASAAMAQSPPMKWGYVPAEHLEMTGFPADTNASAVILADYATVEFGLDWSLTFEHHRRIKIPVELELPRYAARTGTRLFVQPNLMERWTSVPPAVDERTQPVRPTSYSFRDVDTLRYELPEGYVVEALPHPVALEADFGPLTFEAETTVAGSGR